VAHLRARSAHYSANAPLHKTPLSLALASKGASMKYLIPILVFISPLTFAEKWYENGKPAESRSFQGSSGDFGAMILMTTDSQKVLEDWIIPSPGVHILDTEKVLKGKPIEALVLFSGCASNKQGNCVTEVDYQIIKPDGVVYAEYENTELWKNKPAVPVGRLGLAVDRVGLVAEATDPVGQYKVRCIIRDLVSKTEFSIYSTFEVEEANKKLQADAKDAWLN